MGLMNELDRFVEGEYGIEDQEGIAQVMEQGLSVEKGITEDDVDKEELDAGIKIEMEHTNNSKIAKKIALDHLAEIPDYYTRLIAMEKEAGRDLDEFMKRY